MKLAININVIEINIIIVCLITSNFKFMQCLRIPLYNLIPLSQRIKKAGRKNIFCNNKPKITKIHPFFIPKHAIIADIV